MDKTSVSKPTNRRFRPGWAATRLAQHFHMELFARTIRDPFLALLILGVVAVALFASFFLKASADIVFGVIFIGCLTALLEIKARNDNRD